MENNIFPGHSLKTESGVNMAGCAFLCFGLPECKFWTYNPKYVEIFGFFNFMFYRLSKCWLKTSDQANSTTEGSTEGSGYGVEKSAECLGELEGCIEGSSEDSSEDFTEGAMKGSTVESTDRFISGQRVCGAAGYGIKL